MRRNIRKDRLTNMDRLKEVATALLFQEPVQCETIGFVVYHPFTNSNMVAIHDKETGETKIIDIINDVDGRRLWMIEIRSMIEKATEPYHIIMLMNKPYYFAFIKFAHYYMSNKDLAQILSHAWVCVEYSNDDKNLRPNELIHLFESLPMDLLMTEEDKQLWDTLPETIMIFRGVNKHNESSVGTALSWTLNPETAKWFANRFDDKHEGKVYCQTVNKSDVLAFFNTRNEMEVIIRPTGKELLYREPGTLT